MNRDCSLLCYFEVAIAKVLDLLKVLLGWRGRVAFFFNMSPKVIDRFRVSVEDLVVIPLTTSNSTLFAFICLTIFGVVDSDKTVIANLVSSDDC